MANEKINALQNEEYSNDECLDEMIKLENQIVCFVFNKKYQNGCKYDWVIENFKKANITNQHVKTEVLPRLIQTFEEMQSDIRKKLSGNTGERYIAKQLQVAQTHLKDSECLCNLQLQKNTMTTELDNILITSKAIFIIETKYWTKKVQITSDGNYFENDEFRISKNLLEKADRKRIVLYNLLKESKILGEVKLVDLIVNANSGNRRIKNNCERLKFFTDSRDMIDYIKNFQGSDKYSSEQILKVVEYLKSLDNKTRYKVKYDIKQTLQDLVDVMQAIEDEKTKSLGTFERAAITVKEIMKKPQFTFISGLLFGTAVGVTAEYVLNNKTENVTNVFNNERSQ